MPDDHPASRRRRLACWVLLLAAVAALVSRTALKPAPRMIDFAIEYAAADAWAHGQDPFDEVRLRQLWIDRGGARGVREIPSFQISVLPPSTLLVIAPLLLLPPWLAAELWLAISVLLLAAAALAAGRMVGLRWPQAGAILLLSAALACGPAHSGLLVGQVAVPAICLAILSAWCASHGRRIPAAVLLGVAAALKPQVAAAFVAYYLYTQPAAVGLPALLVAAALAGAAAARLHFAGTPWVQHWRANMLAGFAPGGLNDYSVGGLTRDHLINLQLLLHGLLHSRPAEGAAAWTIAGSLAAAWAWLVGRDRRPSDPVLAIATLAALSLLPLYHRYYHLLLLLPALAWGISHGAGPARRQARTLLLLMLLFLAPVGWQTNLIHKRLLPAWVGRSWWWADLAEPINALLLLLISLCLLWAMAAQRRRRPDGASAAVASPRLISSPAAPY